MKTTWLVLLVALTLSATSRAEVTMTLIPASPVQNEPVHVRIRSEPGDVIFAGMFLYERSGVGALPTNQFRIVPSGEALSPNDRPVDHTFYLGRLPQGSYSVILGGDSGTLVVSTLEFTVETSVRNRFIGGEREANAPLDHSGLWYKPGETGSSIVLVQSPISRDLAGGLYGYDEDGNPVWYTLAPAVWLDARLDTARSDVFRSRGSPLGEPYVGSEFQTTKIGEIFLHFNGIDALHVDYEIEGKVGSEDYRRFGF